jgi:hypothetical protein
MWRLGVGGWKMNLDFRRAYLFDFSSLQMSRLNREIS